MAQRQTSAAAKRKKLFILAAVCALLSALLAPTPALATRTLPANPGPTLAPQLPQLEALGADLDAGDAFPLLGPEDRLVFATLTLLDHDQVDAVVARQRHELHLLSADLARAREAARALKTATGVSISLRADKHMEWRDLRPESHRQSYQGLWTDPTTGLSYARNRWYDARIASWLSEDPLGPVDSPNLYAFVGWGPHVGTDPLGTQVAPPPVPISGDMLRLLYADLATRTLGDDPGRPTLLPVVGNGEPEGVFVNGILNPPERALQSADAGSVLVGAPLQPVWNPTDGNAVFDIAQTALVNKLNMVDPTTELVVDTVRGMLAQREGPILLVGHSQGAAIVSSAAEQLNPEERARVEMVTIGGAAHGFPEGMRSVTAYVNTWDVVPMAFGAGAPFSPLLDENDNTTRVYYEFGVTPLFSFSTIHGVDDYLNAARRLPAADTPLEAAITRRLDAAEDFRDGFDVPVEPQTPQAGVIVGFWGCVVDGRPMERGAPVRPPGQ